MGKSFKVLAAIGIVVSVVVGQTDRFDSPGNYRNLIFNDVANRRAIIEVFASGGGGGGQGGHSTNFALGSGGGGGSGAAAYMRFYATGPVEFNIIVGSGGGGGANEHTSLTAATQNHWRAGHRGGDGEETRVVGAGHNLIVRGGLGGGEGRPDLCNNNNYEPCRALNGGSGAPAVERPSGIRNDYWQQVQGDRGEDGEHDLPRPINNPAGGIDRNFRAGLSPTTWHASSGGRGGYNTQRGISGGNGQVKVVVTPFTIPVPTLLSYTITPLGRNGGSIVLNWGLTTNHQDVDRGNFWVFRRTNNTGNWTRLNSAGIPRESERTFTDSTTIYNTNYQYAVVYMESGTPAASLADLPEISDNPGVRHATTSANISVNVDPWIFGSLNYDFDAEARNGGEVTLTWSFALDQRLRTVGHIWVYRRIADDEENWQLLNENGLAPTASHFVDRTTEFDRIYEYAVVYQDFGRPANSLTEITRQDTPYVLRSATVSVSASPVGGVVIPSPRDLTLAFNDRAERAGANGQVVLTWRYINPHSNAGSFYVWRREEVPTLGSWELLNPTGIAVVNLSDNRELLWVDNTTFSGKTYQYHVAFVGSPNAPNASAPQSVHSASLAIETSPRFIQSGGNAYNPFNSHSDRRVIDGITYVDIWGIGARQVGTPNTMYMQLLNGFQFINGDTHISRWIDAGNLFATSNAQNTNFFNNARGILNARRAANSEASVARVSGRLNVANNIAAAAYYMRAEFNDRFPYAISGAFAQPTALDGLSANSQPVFWVLDRYLVHNNNTDNDFDVGNEDFAYYGVGLIFYDFRTHFLETGEVFYSALANVSSVPSAANPNFDFDFGEIENAIVFGVKNASGATVNATQTWADKTSVMLSNSVSALQGHSMSHMIGEGQSWNTKIWNETRDESSDRRKDTHNFSASANVNAKWGWGSASASTNYSYEYVRERIDTWSETTGNSREDSGTFNEEFTTAEMFQHTQGTETSKTVSRENKFSVEVPVPPFTQVVMRQGEATVSMRVDYDFPVAISYKVKIVTLGSNRNGEAFMRTVGVFGTENDMATIAEMDAAENLHVRWNNRGIGGFESKYAAPTVAFNNILPQMRTTTGNISNFDLWGYNGRELRNISANDFERDFIHPITVNMRTETRPMTVVRASFSQQMSSINSEIFDFQPLYPLWQIRTVENIGSIELTAGDHYFIDRINLRGTMQNGAEFYGFHQNHGGWHLLNADGSMHDGSIAELERSTGTLRPIVRAKENITVAQRVFLRYLIHDNIYSFDGGNGFMRPQDVQHTATIEVNVRPASIPITPIYHPLWRIDMVENIDSISLANGERTFIDRIELRGRTQNGAMYSDFNIDNGEWVLTNADGEPHDGSIARIVSAVGTGRMIVVADENNAGTVFMRYIIRDGIYRLNNSGGFITSDDLRSTAIIPIIVKSSGPISIRDNRNRDTGQGILLERPIVSDVAKFSVVTPESATVNVRILDNLGNAVFQTSGRNTDVFTWNLTNPAGRYVANGTYLIIVEATGVSGRRFTYSARIGVSR